MESRITNSSEKLNIQKGTICFYAYYAIMTLMKSLGFDSGNDIYMLLFMMGILLLFYKIIVTAYSVKEILFVAAMLAIGVVCVIISDEKTIILLVITIAGLKKCDFTDVIKVAFWVRVVTTSMLVLLSMAEIFNPGIESIITSKFIWIDVYSFGYSTPNNAFINIFLIVIMYMYINYNKINYKNIIILGSIILLAFQFTNSRTGTLLFFFLLLLLFLDKFLYLTTYRKIMQVVLVIIPAFCGIFSWIVTIFYSHNGSYVWEFINRIFSGRLNITNKYYNALPISLLPRNHVIMESLRDFGFIDNMYMNVFLNDGLIVFIILLIIMTWSNYKLYKAKYYRELIFIAVFSVYAILEEFPLNPIVNPFVMFIGLVLYNEIFVDGKQISYVKKRKKGEKR